MALFGKKTTESKRAPKAEKAQKREYKGGVINRDLSHVIVRPVITEKAAAMGDKNIYTFEIARSASKIDVREAVRKLWNVTPLKIAIVNRPPRSIVIRAKNRKGTHPGMKKAYVYLRKDDRIELA